MKVTFVRREYIAHNISSFYFKPDKPIHYIAGQFTEIYLPHEHHDKRGTKRWFTLSSAPSDELLAVTTNFAPEKSSSFKEELLSLQHGAELSAASPMGDFVLPKDPSIPLVFVAGGIGCTPFHSIIKELQNTGEERDITLLYSARTLDTVAFRETFDQLGEKFKIILSQEDWDGLTGQISAEMILELTQPSDDHYLYISGPEPMVETIWKDLKASGFNKRHIYTDFFPNYPIL